ncbi:hypothetical protein DFA_06823 [Cavenderia fasciculata]|uniref:Uncharacterized protein n=1 Tax=Cavenderia fasciculata TaxID=261658 RepID=F4Q2D6_CACFS|nr:uncharacterized protein DFA_06823 [Cavenderia fasciculata]EGG18156.1 hypothetical protein DFA_06823 [Cavenderia fasciculata]|eukprot:XP_004366197.1 hypothetical protein DFA_06823 [Cavenderia fasciculata]
MSTETITTPSMVDITLLQDNNEESTLTEPVKVLEDSSGSSSSEFDLNVLEELQSIIKGIIVKHLSSVTITTTTNEQHDDKEKEDDGEKEIKANGDQEEQKQERLQDTHSNIVVYPFDHLSQDELKQLIGDDEQPTLFLDPLQATKFNYDNQLDYLMLLKNNKLYYPSKPYHKHVGIVLYAWGALQRFPVSFNQLYGLNETVIVKDTIDNNNNVKQEGEERESSTSTSTTKSVDENNTTSLNSPESSTSTTTSTTTPPPPITIQINQLTNQTNTDRLVRLISNWKNDMIKDKEEQVYQFLKPLTMRCILTMFGVRKTLGSVDTYFPPGPIKLINTSNQLHSPKSASKLTVSSRALCKHGIRSENSFWGSGKGPEPIKNLRAEKVMVSILSDPTWINIHLLPHNITIIEIRNYLGYGLRWDASGESFRGYLEPQMEDGHEKGWKH